MYAKPHTQSRIMIPFFSGNFSHVGNMFRHVGILFWYLHCTYMYVKAIPMTNVALD